MPVQNPKRLLFHESINLRDSGGLAPIEGRPAVDQAVARGSGGVLKKGDPGPSADGALEDTERTTKEKPIDEVVVGDQAPERVLFIGS
jgi:hypothetical protein